MAQPSVSFEFFPPKTDAALDGLVATARALEQAGPAFMTVTFGAGGSTREGTVRTLKALQDVTAVPLGAHLTFICMTRTEIDAYLDSLWDMGVRRVVALRGDLPADQKDVKWPLDPDPAYYQTTSEFVGAIKKRHPFDVSVGAYPEKHPDAPSEQADLDALKKKCDAGADRAITQFFFDNERYYRFLDRVAAAGIQTPVVPGLMPIASYAGVLKFAAACGAGVPETFRRAFDSACEEDHPRIAEDLLRAQVEDLAAHGVPHLHFYTLNRAELPRNACKALRVGV